MAKDFGKANSVNKIREVAKANDEKANVIQVKMINDVNLVNYPRNNEDISNTEDLELSMKQNGFTDPIEVTAFGMEEGKYLIVSGHRRRAAAKKVNINTFPCIIKTFKSEADIHNYVLLANSQRDSSKDPLLYCKRYKMHEEYLKESGFKGSIREEIARRLGMSVQQADRYKQFNKLILPVWEMVREEKVGIFNLNAMAQFTEEQQEEIVSILEDCLERGVSLTRETCKKIIDGYRNGKCSYQEIMVSENVMNPPSSSDGVSVMNINHEPSEALEQSHNRNDEINHDFSHREGLGSEIQSEERLTEEDKEVIEMSEKEKDKPKPSAEEKRLGNGLKINSLLEKLENTLNEYYEFKDKDTALTVMNAMVNVSKVVFCELERIKDEYGIDEAKFKNQIESLLKEISLYR